MRNDTGSKPSVTRIDRFHCSGLPAAFDCSTLNDWMLTVRPSIFDRVDTITPCVSALKRITLCVTTCDRFATFDSADTNTHRHHIGHCIMSSIVIDPSLTPSLRDTSSLWYWQWRKQNLAQNSDVDFGKAFADGKVETFQVSQDVTGFGWTYARCFFKLNTSSCIYVSVPMEAPFAFEYSHKKGWMCENQELWQAKFSASVWGDSSFGNTHLVFVRRIEKKK